jgi:integrase
MPLTAITRGQVKAFLNERAAAGAAANTIRNIVAPMRAMLASAVEDELIRANPAAGIRRPGRQAKKIEPPSPARVHAVVAAASEPARVPILLAAIAGLRRGEIFALRWADVDFERRIIRVHASNQGAGLVTETKTAAGERLVPMFGSLRAVLLEHKAATPFKRPEDFLFATPAGTPESPNGWLKREFYPALNGAGVGYFRFHDLRHFAVSQLIAQGANILQLARVAGHADPSVTLKVYSHLMAEGLAEAATRYDPLRAVAVDAG